jgi:tetratricopeptide (TPR) repeat protein
MESLDAAGDEFLSLDDEGNWARSRISWIIACTSLGHVEKALQQATRARKVFMQLGEFYWVCITDHNTAWIYEEVGRYQDALKLYESMLAILPTLTDPDQATIKRTIAIAQVNQATNLSWLGKFEQAYHLLQEAQANFIALGEISLFLSSEIDMVGLDYAQGYYGSVLRRYYQAHERLVQNKVDNPLVMAELKLWTANCLVKLNRALEACRLMDEAVGVYRQLGTSLQTSNALCEYATTLKASGRFKEALAALDEARTLFDQGGFDRYASDARLQQAELLLDMSFFGEAYNQACLVRKYFESQGLITRSIRAGLVMAGALIGSTHLESMYQVGLERGEKLQSMPLQEAVSLCEQATLAARQHNLQELAYKSQYLLGRLAMIQNDINKADKHYQVAIYQIERILNDLVYDLSPSFLHTTWMVYEDMIALCLQRGQAERAFSFLERARSMALRQYLSKSKIPINETAVKGNAASQSVLLESSAIRLRTQYELRDWQEKYHDFSVLLADLDTSVSPTVDREVILSELKRCETKINELFERLLLYEVDIPVVSHASRSRKYGDLKDITHTTQQKEMEQLRQHLSSNQLLLAYYLYKGNLVTFAITSERLITFEYPNGGEQLERLLPLLHAHLDPRGWSDYKNPPLQSVLRLLRKLYDLLIAPVESLLPSQPGHLTIVPYGLLHELPFHALYDGSHYLVENFQVNYLPACSILSHLKTHGDKQEVLSIDSEVSTRFPLVFGYSEIGHLQSIHNEAQTIA